MNSLSSLDVELKFKFHRKGQYYIIYMFTFLQSSVDDASGDHHFRKLANDITSQLEINFGDLGRPGRGRGGPRGGRGGRGAPATRPPRERRPDKVQSLCVFDLQVCIYICVTV